jgi:hypothetical protein
MGQSKLLVDPTTKDKTADKKPGRAPPATSERWFVD